MKVKIKVDKSFIKDFNKISDKDIKAKIKLLLKNLEKIENFQEIPNLKKLKGFEDFYRISFNKYRLGFRYSNGEVIFIKVMLRKDIYRYFP